MPDLGKGFPDDDFVGSPVVAESAACEGEIVAAQAKSGTLFGWRANAIAAGPVWSLALQKSRPRCAAPHPADVLRSDSTRSSS